MESLSKSNVLDEICTPEIASAFAGRLLLKKIEAAGLNFSERAASELALQLVSNSMLAGETVSKYHVSHTGILKSLYRRSSWAYYKENSNSYRENRFCSWPP